MLSETVQLALIIATPVFAAGGAYAAVHVKLKWHWAEIQNAKREAKRAHARIDRLEDRLSWDTYTGN